MREPSAIITAKVTSFGGSQYKRGFLWIGFSAALEGWFFIRSMFITNWPFEKD